MNINKIRIKKLLIGLSVIAITGVSVGTMVSCSGSTAARGSIIEKKFGASQRLNLGLTKNPVIPGIPTTANLYDAKFNANAIKIINDYQNQITVASLQKDFNEVLTEFYEIYEVETEETEIELSKIVVKSLNTQTKAFTLEVEYEVENETDSREEVKKKLDILWTPNMTAISKADIESLKTAILGYSSTDTNVDIEDLRELFLGEKDDDDDDDIGIFDRIARINKSYKDMAQMIAYNLTLKDVFGPIIEHEKPKSDLDGAVARMKRAGTVVDLNTNFKVPSLVLNSQPTALIPDVQPKINFTVNDATANAAINAYVATTPPLFGQPAWELKPANAQFKTTWDKIFVNPFDATNPDYQAITNLVMIKIDNSPNQGKDFVSYMLLIESGGIGGTYDAVMVTAPFPTPKTITLTKKALPVGFKVPVAILDGATGPLAPLEMKKGLFDLLFTATPAIAPADWMHLILSKVGPGPDKHQLSISSINPYVIAFAGQPADLISNEFEVKQSVSAALTKKTPPADGILQSVIDNAVSGDPSGIMDRIALFNMLFTSSPELQPEDLGFIVLEKTAGKNTITVSSQVPQILSFTGDLESNPYTIKAPPVGLTEYAIEAKTFDPGSVPEAVLTAGSKFDSTPAEKKALFDLLFTSDKIITDEDWAVIILNFSPPTNKVMMMSLDPETVKLNGTIISNDINLPALSVR
ncbi:MAG: hypothetical protein ACRCVI_00865 [Mycoplasmoidaceae bacterium]